MQREGNSFISFESTFFTVEIILLCSILVLVYCPRVVTKSQAVCVCLTLEGSDQWLAVRHQSVGLITLGLKVIILF